jgi:hypothetical protein
MTFFEKEPYNREPVACLLVRPRNQPGNGAVILQILRSDAVSAFHYRVTGIRNGKETIIASWGYLGGGGSGVEFEAGGVWTLDFPDDCVSPRVQVAAALNGEFLGPWSVEYVHLG